MDKNFWEKLVKEIEKLKESDMGKITINWNKQKKNIDIITEIHQRIKLSLDTSTSKKV